MGRGGRRCSISAVSPLAEPPQGRRAGPPQARGRHGRRPGRGRGHAAGGRASHRAPRITQAEGMNGRALIRRAWRPRRLPRRSVHRHTAAAPGAADLATGQQSAATPHRLAVHRCSPVAGVILADRSEAAAGCDARVWAAPGLLGQLAQPAAMLRRAAASHCWPWRRRTVTQKRQALSPACSAGPARPEIAQMNKRKHRIVKPGVARHPADSRIREDRHVWCWPNGRRYGCVVEERAAGHYPSQGVTRCPPGWSG
jgi:hypothetical protein